MESRNSRRRREGKLWSRCKINKLRNNKKIEYSERKGAKQLTNPLFFEENTLYVFIGMFVFYKYTVKSRGVACI